MIFSKLNVGCGPNLVNTYGWLNIDSYYTHISDNFREWDITTPIIELENDLTEKFDFVLVNHVLCTMNPYEVRSALMNLHSCLKPNGIIQIIDMDLVKVFKSYEEKRYHDIPIKEGNADFKLCMAISGYGTRKSLFTKKRMIDELKLVGFRETETIKSSEHDTRPNESFIIEAIK